MNFIEAVNSGKRFRPISEIGKYPWLRINGSKNIESEDEAKHFLNDVAYFNSPFEVEEKQITITEVEFEAAYDKCNKGYSYNMIKELKKHLGF